MKRILAVLLCLILVLSTATACGSKEEASSDGSGHHQAGYLPGWGSMLPLLGLLP